LAANVVRVWRLRRHWIRILGFRLIASKPAKKYLADNTSYWIDPRKIVFAMNSEGFDQTTPAPQERNNWEFPLSEYHGRVIGGDWDRLERRFSGLDFFRTYEERSRQGTSWEQLPYYKRVLEQIEKGNSKWGCNSKQDLDERCRKLDVIFNDVKQNGYKSREMQRIEHRKDSLFSEYDEIAVNIGRDGDLIFNNGRHRLTFAKVAGVEKVPVTVTVRHSGWEEFVKQVEAYIQRNNGSVLAPLAHIGLQHIRAPGNDAGFDMIRGNIGLENSTLLDIGARWGYYCHRFEDDGFRCTAVGSDPENLYFLKKLKRADNKTFEVITESILTLSKRTTLKYDVVLALDALHRFLVDETSLEGLKHLLRNLDMKEMYFEPHVDDGQKQGRAFVNFSPEEFVSFILENSSLNNYKLIRDSGEGGVIYKLWRQTTGGN
jgi:2-polyprenyl-3-methyl-5-hydroxy-6-metoxy-1,4-benzoquinol methylase